ncbi:MAG: transglycosylase SLT domain-containing protein [Xanthobacteraceae bacterium]
MSTSLARVAVRQGRIRAGFKVVLCRLHGWRQRAGWPLEKLAAAPKAVRIVVAVTMVLAAVTVANLVYQVARKPTEMLFPASGALNKAPADTWRQYGPLFRAYSTGRITPELLAALAQMESAGNPVARTYWRWRLTLNPFAVYAPASSAVGLYQMTDAAFSEARRSCIRRHAVVADACGFNSLYFRVVPSHAVELTAVYLDRNVAAVLARQPGTAASAQQKQDLAALVHLCGAGPALAFARRGFHAVAGERCGDHAVAAYLAKVNAMKRQFLRLAADRY